MRGKPKDNLKNEFHLRENAAEINELNSHK